MQKQKKTILAIACAIIVVGTLLFYFVIPTTDYYRIDITPSLIESLYGGYSDPDIDVKEVKGKDTWNETYVYQQFILKTTQEIIEQKLSDSDTNFLKNRVSILVSVKHKRSFNPEKVLKELRSIRYIYDIERLQQEYDIEVKAAVL